MTDAKKTTSSSADAGEGSSGGRVGAWTEAERNQLLLRVLATLLPDGRGVDWKSVQMEGRTLKALQGQWTSIVAQMRDLKLGGDGNTPSKPRSGGKKATPKKTVTTAESDEANNDAAEGDTLKKPVTPRKRGAATNAGDGSAKKKRTPAKKASAKAQADDVTKNETEDEAKADVKDDDMKNTKEEEDQEEQ